jgi:hypothetical protein
MKCKITIIFYKNKEFSKKTILLSIFMFLTSDLIYSKAMCLIEFSFVLYRDRSLRNYRRSIFLEAIPCW